MPDDLGNNMYDYEFYSDMGGDDIEWDVEIHLELDRVFDEFESDQIRSLDEIYNEEIRTGSIYRNWF